LHTCQRNLGLLPTPDEKNQYSATPLLVQYKRQANSLLSMKNYYTPLVISRNDTNKQLTLLSQCKLALTAMNKLLPYKIIGAPKKFKN
jgi:hypothetical protein